MILIRIQDAINKWYSPSGSMIIIGFLLLLGITGCESVKRIGEDIKQGLEQGIAQGQLASSEVGAAIGAWVGDRMGGTEGAVVGGVAGFLIGGEIGRLLAEQDRRIAADNTVTALEVSQAQDGKEATSSWTSVENEGVSGSATATGVGEGCYNVQEIAVIPGRGDVRQEVRYCEREGKWEEVA